MIRLSFLKTLSFLLPLLVSSCANETKMGEKDVNKAKEILDTATGLPYFGWSNDKTNDRYLQTYSASSMVCFVSTLKFSSKRNWTNDAYECTNREGITTIKHIYEEHVNEELASRFESVNAESETPEDFNEKSMVKADFLKIIAANIKGATLLSDKKADRLGHSTESIVDYCSLDLEGDISFGVDALRSSVVFEKVNRVTFEAWIMDGAPTARVEINGKINGSKYSSKMMFGFTI